MRIGKEARITGVDAGGVAYSKGAFYAIVIMILMCFQPSKAIGYTTPYAFIFFATILAAPIGLIRRVIIWVGSWVLLFLFYEGIEQSFQPQSFALSFVTYSSFAVFLIPNSFFTPGLYARVRKFLLPFLIFQCFLGVAQATYGHFITGSFDSSNGDIVRGTMAATLAADTAATNNMFTVSVMYIMLALFPVIVIRKKGYIWLGLGLVCIILASVMHATFFAVAGAGFATCCVTKNPFRTLGVLTAGFTSVVLVVYFFMPTDVGKVGDFRDQFFAGATPKAELYLTSFGILPRQVPLVTVVGLGPGQFSSRAAMISTGEYLNAKGGGEQLPLLRRRIPKYTGIYELPLWDEVEAVNWNGSTQTCFASWASVATEFGFLPFIILTTGLLLFVARLSIRIRSAFRQPNGEYIRLEALSLITGIALMFLLGFQENYWEMPQAILIGLVLMRFMYASIVAGTQSAGANATQWGRFRRVRKSSVVAARLPGSAVQPGWIG